MKRKAMKTIKLQMEGGCTAFVADPAGVQCGLDDGNSC
jgi:hypothetical protein